MSDYSTPDPSEELPETRPTDPNATEPGRLQDPDEDMDSESDGAYEEELESDEIGPSTGGMGAGEADGADLYPPLDASSDESLAPRTE